MFTFTAYSRVSLKQTVLNNHTTTRFITVALFMVSITIVGGALFLLSDAGVLSPSQQNHGVPQHAHAPKQAHRSSFPSATVYLPLLLKQDTSPLERTFEDSTPIWVHDHAPDPHEIAMFRHTFTLNAPLTSTQLAMFADTRYEVWVDGAWVGRGPARFSLHTREYDTYHLDTLAPGTHLIAVIVQWAPNTRRSESTTPFLKAHIHGSTPAGDTITIGTGTHWKAKKCTAWRQDAALVHAWKLIGPTEMLDLRKLPPDWMLPVRTNEQQSARIMRDASLVNAPPLPEWIPDFSDAHWATAVAKDPPEATYHPRSIAPLEDVPVQAEVIETGLLSPGYVMGELLPTSHTHTMTFSVSANTSVPEPVEGTIPSTMPEPVEGTTLHIETLALSTNARLEDEALYTRPDITTPISIYLDSQALPLHVDTSRPPDVLTASVPLTPGLHTLSLTNTHTQPWPVSISCALCDAVEDLALPFQQGNHAGRRLLLSNPVNNPDVAIISTEGQFDILFEHTPAYAILDLGRIVHGRVTVEASGSSGAVVDVGWDERLWHDTRPLPYPGSLHPQWNQTDSWVLDSTTRSLTTLDARTGRYVLIAVWGESPIHLEHIRVLEERYPVEQKGYFESSNALLNTIWQIGVDTIYPNMTDAYADPWRERGQWWGDAFAVDHVNQVAFGDTSLLRRGLWFMAEAFQDGKPTALAPNGDGSLLFDYAMLWVQSLHDYWQQTQDGAFLERVYPVLIEFLDYLHTFENPDTGLLDIPPGHWSKTALIDWAAYTSRYGQSTALNALYYDTLRDSAAIATILDNPEQADIWRARARRVKTQANASLYQPAQKRYITSIVAGEMVAPTPQAQAWALTYGLVPEEEQQGVADSLLELLSLDPTNPNVEIYGMFWVLEALGRANRIHDAINVIERYYGYMIDLGATNWWEAFNAHTNYRAALSHGWGGAPTWFLTTYALGAQRTGPDTWQIHPGLIQTGVLSSTVPPVPARAQDSSRTLLPSTGAGTSSIRDIPNLSGALPLDNGAVHISWTYIDNEHVRLHVDTPLNSSGEVVIPWQSETVLMHNGTVVWAESSLADGVARKGDSIHLTLQGGHHTIEMR